MGDIMYFGYLILLLLYYHCVASRYKNLYGVLIMKSIPQGISIIYFNDESKNIYAELPQDREQAKRLSKRIYKGAMTAICAEQASGKALAPACD